MSNHSSQNASVVSLEQDPVSFKLAGIACVVIGIAIALVLSAFAFMDYTRQVQVVGNYTDLTHQFIAQNNGKVEQLFTKTFEDCHQDYLQKKNPPGYGYPNNAYMPSTTCSAAQSAFSTWNKQLIKDFPSTAYVRVSGTQVEVIRASGDYYPPEDIAYDNFSKQDQLKSYFFRHEKIRMWDNFLTYMTQKQVIVPVEQNGQIIGYVFIGVIEK